MRQDKLMISLHYQFLRIISIPFYTQNNVNTRVCVSAVAFFAAAEFCRFLHADNVKSFDDVTDLKCNLKCFLMIIYQNISVYHPVLYTVRSMRNVTDIYLFMDKKCFRFSIKIS